MLRILSASVALCFVATTTWAQEPKALVGEIVLNGTVDAVDVVNNRLTIIATGFTGPTGATKELPQPKSKTIQLRDDTLFTEQNGGKNPSLGDLEMGQKVRIAGKEVGGKPFVARQLSWTAPKQVLPTDPLTPPGIGAFLPLPQKGQELTIQFVNAGFASKFTLQPFNHMEKRPTFFFAYRLKGPKVEGENEFGARKTLSDFVKIRRVLGPQGQIITSSTVNPVDYKNFNDPGQLVFLDAVNPAWSNLILEFEILNPDAPPEARGVINSTLVFDHLPVPGAVGNSISVNRTQTTKLGTEINLEKVLGVHVGNGDYTQSELSWKAPANVPDLSLTLSVGEIVSGGQKWELFNGSGSANGNFISTGRDTLGPAGVKEMDVTYKVKESALSLQDREWFSVLRVSLPVATLLEKTLPGVEAAQKEETSRVLAEGQGNKVRVMAEYREGGMPNSGNGYIWIKGDDLGQHENWFIREISGTDEKGEKPAFSSFNLGSYLYWKADSSRVEPGEYAHPTMFLGKSKPTSVDLQVKLEKASRIEHASRLQDLPVPGTGKTLEVPQGAIEDDFLSVRRVTSYVDPVQLPGFKGQRSPNNTRAGLAVVVETSPVFPDSQVRFNVNTSTDSSGRDLASRWEYAYEVFEGDRTAEGPVNSKLRTILVPLPASDIKTFEILLQTVETKWSGETQTVEVKDVPVQKVG